MSNQSAFIQDHILKYALKLSLREPSILQALRIETSQMDESNMQVAPEQGQLMRMMVSLLQARKIIEIGTFTGYSTLSMALSLPDDGEIIACDLSEEWTAVASRYWQEAGVSDRISLRIAPATITLQKLIANGQSDSFDMIFIDADKENYATYYSLSLQLLRKDGLMMIDNTLWSGKVINPGFKDAETNAIRNLNEQIYQDERVESFLLPIADGLTLVRKC